MIQYRHNFKSTYRYLTVSALAISAALAATATPAKAQQTTVRQQAAADVEEIVVTARKRQESIISVPVVETAIPQAKLESMQTTELADLPKIVPGLIVTTNVALTGNQTNLRGVGQINGNFGIDSSVPLNLDGLSVGTGLAFQSGLFDLQQIEVLKGPQALFYGKGAPGGVISLRSADPTDKFEVMARASYEFEARTPREEFTISGPVTDTLKLRLASMYSTSQGYFNETGVPISATGAEPVPNKRGPNDTTYMVRGTALWNPNDQFDARLKVNLTHDKAITPETIELISCPEGLIGPSGIPFQGNQECTMDRNNRTIDMDPAAFPALQGYHGGHTFLETDQRYGTLELNYHPTKDLTLTSVTGYYYLRAESLLNDFATTAAGTPFADLQRFHRRDFTEEVRLNSDFDKPLNFTLGGLYEDGQFHGNDILAADIRYGFPPILQWDDLVINVKAYSIFGQARYKFTPELELSAGVRWTDETRNEIPLNVLTNTLDPLANTHLHSDNFAPEVTLSYRPTDDMTLFAAFKQAYKSGSFSLGSLPPPGSDNSFGDEKAQGGEVGLKSRWLDRQLAVNAAAYYYHYTGLQVGSSIALPGGVIVNQTLNAGAARSYGIDLDAAYAPQAIKGLTVNGSANWNNARFTSLKNAPCFHGQTIAQGCNQVFNAATGLFTAQDLSGTPILRAPEWQFALGFDYEFPVGGDYNIAISSNTVYTSSYAGTLSINRPNNDNYQSAYAKVDLGVTLKSPNDRWEIALLGKNITDKLIAGSYAESDAINTIFGGDISGGTTRGASGIGEMAAFVQPGREIWLRVTLRPFN